MSHSIAYEKIRNDVLGATASIPKGRVSTYASIGEHLEVMPRHVSYILATLKDDQISSLPWFRVIAKDGSVSGTNKVRQAIQIRLLREEGHEFNGTQVIGFDEKLHAFQKPTIRPFSESRGAYSDPLTPTLYPKRQTK
jgi:methylated-DNA-protein-cysteine methyltransferase-like protein